jgi:hypothetical protein
VIEPFYIDDHECTICGFSSSDNLIIQDELRCVKCNPIGFPDALERLDSFLENLDLANSDSRAIIVGISKMNATIPYFKRGPNHGLIAVYRIDDFTLMLHLHECQISTEFGYTNTGRLSRGLYENWTEWSMGQIAQRVSDLLDVLGTKKRISHVSR